jgi:hypothetical protein
MQINMRTYCLLGYDLWAILGGIGAASVVAVEATNRILGDRDGDRTQKPEAIDQKPEATSGILGDRRDSSGVRK